ncbi:MAG: hypothetical protein IJV33_06240 [Bacteroidaceae bacterium]|nr:hypothetical protein [Bacteroidaceae bacterium]
MSYFYFFRYKNSVGTELNRANLHILRQHRYDADQHEDDCTDKYTK